MSDSLDINFSSWVYLCTIVFTNNFSFQQSYYRTGKLQARLSRMGLEVSLFYAHEWDTWTKRLQECDGTGPMLGPALLKKITISLVCYINRQRKYALWYSTDRDIENRNMEYTETGTHAYQ